jgi:hypothetical protein
MKKTQAIRWDGDPELNALLDRLYREQVLIAAEWQRYFNRPDARTRAEVWARHLYAYVTHQAIRFAELYPQVSPAQRSAVCTQLMRAGLPSWLICLCLGQAIDTPLDTLTNLSLGQAIDTPPDTPLEEWLAGVDQLLREVAEKEPRDTL